MSDFWKKRRPQMTDEEERALWERVRTMPSEAAGARRRSPWAALWAKPAVRFGAPVFAVALVAVVWVAQRAPEAPRPEGAGTTMPSPGADAPIVGNSTPAIEAERAPGIVPVEPEARGDAAPAMGELQGQAVQPSRERAADARDEAGSAKEEAQTFAAPPAAPAPAPGRITVERKAEGTRAMTKTGAAEAPAPRKVAVSNGEVDTQAAFGETSADRAVPEARRSGAVSSDLIYIDTNRIADVLHLSPGETVFEQVRLPLTGGVAWIVAGRGLEGTLQFVPFRGGNSEAVQYAWPEQRNADTGIREALVRPQREAGVGVLVMQSGTGFRAQFVRPDGTVQMFAAPRATLRARRAALGVELLLSGTRHAAVLGVRSEAAKLAADHPGDEGTRALLAWCDSMVGSTRPDAVE